MNDRLEFQWMEEKTEDLGWDGHEVEATEPSIFVSALDIPMPESELVRPLEGVNVDFQSFLNRRD